MSQRPRWMLLPALGVLAALVLVAGGPASAAKVTNVKSTVTIKSGEGSEFTGKVTSTQKKCRLGRKVKLVMEPYSGGKDEVVDTAKTNATGAWEMHGSYMAGIYHAEVTSTFVHTDSGTFHCLVAIGVSHRY
jgi:hypothetical protein